MSKNADRILKAEDVSCEGKFRLDLTNNASDMPEGEPADSVLPSARIVESNSKFGVIEIACPCGKTISLRCEYS